jgi:hypothetical protein
MVAILIVQLVGDGSEPGIGFLNGVIQCGNA